MRFLAPFLLLLSLSSLTVMSFADAAPSPAPSGVAVMVDHPPAPPMAPAVVAVAEPAAPPAWAQTVIVGAQKLPVIGPIVTKALIYLGIISSILTMLAAFLSSALTILAGALNYAGLLSAVQKIADFKNGRFMYYLKYLSMFNAQKPDPQ